MEKVYVRIFQEWHNPQVKTVVEKDRDDGGIAYVMDIEDFKKAVEMEIGFKDVGMFKSVTKKELEQKLSDAFDLVISKIKA